MKIFKATIWTLALGVILGFSFGTEALAEEPNVHLQGEIAAQQIDIQREADDPLFSDQWHLEEMKVPEAWDISTGSPETVIATVDTGINLEHEDLQDRVWENEDEIPDNGVDDDGNGYVDDAHGFNFLNDSSDIGDNHGHGTGIASLIAANTNNDIGLAGINWEAKIMPLRALNDLGGGQFEDVSEAVRYATDNGADIINMSFGSINNSAQMESAINYALGEGVIVVAASGNLGSEEILFPARFDDVVAVGAIDENGDKPDFASYGEGLDVVAPGVDIPMAGSDGEKEYVQGSGTSFATAQVSAILSLITGINSHISPSGATDLVQNSAEFLAGQDGYTPEFGYGLIQAPKVIEPFSGGSGEIDISNNNASANGVNQVTVTVSINDESDRPKTGERISARISGSGNIINDSPVTGDQSVVVGETDAQGQMSFTVSSVVPGAKEITILNRTSPVLNNESQSVSFTPASPQYSGAIVDRTEITDPVELGEEFELSVSIRNTGTAAWLGSEATDEGQVRLGTEDPRDRESALSTEEWIDGNRAVAIDPQLVRPGEIGTFTFEAELNQIGSFSETFQPVAEYVSWFSAPSVTWNIESAPEGEAIPEFGAEIEDQGITQENGETTLWVEVENTGSRTWQRDTPDGIDEIKLGTTRARDHFSTLATDDWLAPNRASGPDRDVTENGEITRFEFSIEPSDGSRTAHFQLLSEYNRWFGPIISWEVD